jgi:predicted ribosomally synthesized peptide with SipW-like signal peptide
MNKKKTATLVIATGLIGAIGIGSTLAYFTDSESASNIVTTGDVNISLSYDELSFENFLPGDLIKNGSVLTVESQSADSYLRISLDVTGSDGAETQTADFAALIEDQLNDYGWVAGEAGYYYYQPDAGIAVPGDYIIFNDVTIPDEWGNEYKNLSFQVSINAEAIQARNFTPYTTEDGTIYAWYASDIPAVPVTVSFDDVAIELYADENGDVVLPDSTSNGWYDSAKHVCYVSGASVAADEIENASLSSVEVENLTLTIDCYDRVTKTHFYKTNADVLVPVFDKLQKEVYVSFGNLVPELEGYTRATGNNTVNVNGKTLSSYPGKSINGGNSLSVSDKFFIGRNCTPYSSGPNDTTYYTSLYYISSTNEAKVSVTAFDPEQLTLLCNYDKNN